MVVKRAHDAQKPFVLCVEGRRQGQRLSMKDIIEKGAKGSELILGVRPEDLQVYREKPEEESIEVELYAFEPLGSETIIDSKIGESLVRAKGSADFKATIGDKIYMTINKEKMHVFDKTTSQAVI